VANCIKKLNKTIKKMKHCRLKSLFLLLITFEFALNHEQQENQIPSNNLFDDDTININIPTGDITDMFETHSTPHPDLDDIEFDLDENIEDNQHQNNQEK
jgi:hypothetical protein